ncbi:hypothetical protein ACFXTO_024786 [Malus domestica]
MARTIQPAQIGWVFPCTQQPLWLLGFVLPRPTAYTWPASRPMSSTPPAADSTHHLQPAYAAELPAPNPQASFRWTLSRALS